MIEDPETNGIFNRHCMVYIETVDIYQEAVSEVPKVGDSHQIPAEDSQVQLKANNFVYANNDLGLDAEYDVEVIWPCV